MLPLFYGGTSGNAAQRVVSEAAATVIAGYDAAKLTDHRIFINFPRKLAVGAVAVDLFSKQHGTAAFLFWLPPLYTIFPQKAMVLFAKEQQSCRTEKQ